MSLGHTLIVLAIYLLACARITRLINADTILDPLRLAVARRIHDTERSDRERSRWGTVDYWLGCPWCAGLWICLLAAPIPVHLIGWQGWTVIPVALAASHLIGITARWSVDDDETMEVVKGA